MSSTDSSQLDCSLSGFQVLVMDITNLALLAITLNVSIIEAILSGLPDLAKAFELSYRFLKSSAGFSGYVIAAAYFFGLEFGYGDLLCQAASYGYLVVYYLNIAVTFGQSMN